MKATLPAYLAGAGGWARAARAGPGAAAPLDAPSALAHSPPQCAALTISAAFAARLFASDLRWLRPSVLLIESLGRPASEAGRHLFRGPSAVESETPRSGETSSDGTDALRHTDAREA